MAGVVVPMGSVYRWTPETAIPWMDAAACKRPDVDPESFFPHQSESAQEGRSVCARCDVAERCLAYALENGIEHGTWGGATAHERREMRRGMAPAESVVVQRVRQIRAMHAAGLMDTEIARQLRLTPEQVGRARRMAGLPTNATGGHRAGLVAPRKKVTAEQRAEIRRLHGDGLGDGQIGDRLGMPRATVRMHRTRMGLAPLPNLGRPKRAAS